MHCTVEPPNNGHIGGRNLVLYWEVVSISEVDYQATPLNPEVESIEGCGFQEVNSMMNTFRANTSWSKFK